MIKKLMVSVLSLVVSLLSAEMMLRLYEYKTQGIAIDQKLFVREDPILGWAGEMSLNSSRKDAFKIFIIGDSFTEGNGVPEHERYYSVLRRKLDADVYVYAAAGYSTTQEYLILRKYIDTIRPDVIIIQVCNNDLINNSVALETRSLINNNHRLRPYLVDNSITLLYPSRFGHITYAIVKRSRLALRTLIAGDITLRWFRTNAGLTSIEEHIGETRYEDMYAEATVATKLLMEKIVKLAGAAPVVFFPVDTYPELNSMLKHEMPNAYWIDAPAREIDKLRALSQPVTQDDGSHWNDRGHAIAGSVLLEELLSAQILPAGIVTDK